MTAMYVFFFNDTATTEIYTLSLHDALPISPIKPEKLGITSTEREVTLYLEGIVPSAQSGDGKLEVFVDPDGNGSAFTPAPTDQVYMTLFKVEIGRASCRERV